MPKRCRTINSSSMLFLFTLFLPLRELGWAQIAKQFWYAALRHNIVCWGAYVKRILRHAVPYIGGEAHLSVHQYA